MFDHVHKARGKMFMLAKERELVQKLDARADTGDMD